ncbi:uncharacterized protein [Onthophagus taurus]|uniref:uncharacterized protein n=1 Tax=Onthophagus taurus TaxID=166361 RepID=UPI0039BE8B68
MEIDGFTEIHVIMKFKNLRSSYLQEIKKIRQSMKSGCCSDEVYTPKVRWFKIMDSFLKPDVKARETQSNLDITVLINEKPDSPEDNAIASQQLNEEQPSTSKETQCQNDSLKRKFLHTSTTTPRKKKLCSTPAGDINSAIDKLDDISKRAANASVSKEDCFDHFGKYIASLLRTLPLDRSPQLQSEIVSMILKPTIPTYSILSSAYSQNSNFITNSTTNSESIQSGPPSRSFDL